MINIFPTRTRNIDDWPETVKNSPEIPEELQPRYVWCISQEENLCRQVEIPITQNNSPDKWKRAGNI